MQNPGHYNDVLDVVDPLRRYVTAHASAQDTDDVVQETLARVLAASNRLSGEVTVAYALVVAKRIMIDQAIDSGRRRRNAHRFIDLTSTPAPDEVLIGAEQRAALAQALGRLEPSHRDALMAHVVDDHSTTDIAADTGSSKGSVAAQLARTRARARLDYILALRHIEPPTPRCRPVLLAISAADTRRQDALRAADHLLSCETCASISEPLLKRRAGLAAVLPWLGIGPALETVRRLVKRSPGHAVAAATAMTTLGGAALVMALHTSTPPPPAASSAGSAGSSAAATANAPAVQSTRTTGTLVRLSDGRSLLAPAADLSAMTGTTVRARAVPVTGVPADEGFWIGNGRNQVWVKIINVSGESTITVQKGEKVSFTGKLVGHNDRFARHAGVTTREGRELLTAEHAHLEVDEQQLEVSRPG